jgi:alkylation response protein AidB-like acyl-CoA dehydrogenase
MPKDLRTFLDQVTRAMPDEVRVVSQEIEPQWGATAVAARLEQQQRFPALIFRRIRGSRVPVVLNLGGADAGGRLVARVREAARIGSAAQALGIAGASLDAALAYAQEREQFGQPIARFEGLRHLLADVALAVDAARWLVYRAAWVWERGESAALAAALAKLQAGEAAMLAATKAVQVHGGYGYMREAAVQRYFRDAKVTQAAEGNALQQRSAIAYGLLPGG